MHPDIYLVFFCPINYRDLRLILFHLKNHLRNSSWAAAAAILAYCPKVIPTVHLVYSFRVAVPSSWNSMRIPFEIKRDRVAL